MMLYARSRSPCACVGSDTKMHQANAIKATRLARMKPASMPRLLQQELNADHAAQKVGRAQSEGIANGITIEYFHPLWDRNLEAVDLVGARFPVEAPKFAS